MDQADRDLLKGALNQVAAWLLNVSTRRVPLPPRPERGALLASIVSSGDRQLTAGDLAAYFAGMTSDRILVAYTAEDVRNLDDALIELNWFIPSSIARNLSHCLHPRPRILRQNERIAC